MDSFRVTLHESINDQNRNKTCFIFHCSATCDWISTLLPAYSLHSSAWQSKISVEKERLSGLFCANCSLPPAPRTWGLRWIVVLFCQEYRLNPRSLRSSLGCCCEQLSWHLKCVTWFLACLINRGVHWSCDKPFWFLWSAWPLVLERDHGMYEQRSQIHNLHRHRESWVYVVRESDWGIGLPNL